jgi:AraC-like DNA-binding protein
MYRGAIVPTAVTFAEGLPPAWTPAGAVAGGAPSPELLGSLRHLIRSLLPAGRPTVGHLAELSGHSLRSFQRHLAAAGVSFSDLVEEVRREMALELMRDPGVRLIEVGLELGYSDAATFSRAFKRWTGLTPRQCRRSLRKPIAGASAPPAFGARRAR